MVTSESKFEIDSGMLTLLLYCFLLQEKNIFFIIIILSADPVDPERNRI